MKKILERIYLIIILIFMYAPIFTLIVLSFNSSKSRARWGGFTLGWYINLLSDEAVASALFNTLTIAILATIFSTIMEASPRSVSIRDVCFLGVNGMVEI